MQLVPKTGALEAYAKLFGNRKTPSSKYLYDPRNNIELGVAYFDILQTRYMKLIDDPVSRTYCAVAAYNAGASNVGRAFIPEKSIMKASPVINTLQANEVYERLVDTFHIEETRLYTQKVLTRRVAYFDWKWNAARARELRLHVSIIIQEHSSLFYIIHDVHNVSDLSNWEYDQENDKRLWQCLILYL